MGLDISFYKRAYSHHNPNEPININKDGSKEYEKMTEIAYFRKVNFLMSYFEYFEKCESEGDFQGDCTYVPIHVDEIKSLIEDCTEVLKLRGKKDISPDELPIQPQEGFFFGSTDIDEYFFNDVKAVKKSFEKILAELKDNEEVFMWTWW